MKARVRTGLISAALAPLILTACGGGDSTGTNHGPPAFMSKVGSDPASVIAGGGSVTPATVIADANGSAAAKFITGTTPGTNTVIATVSGVSAVPAIAFTVTTVTAGTIVWSAIPMDTLRGVWGTSASDVWAVGYHGTPEHFNGTSWSPVTSGTTEPLVGVWGTSPSNVWIVGGFTGTILHYNGTSWSSALERGQIGILFGVWGGAASDVWGLGDIGHAL